MRSRLPAIVRLVRSVPTIAVITLLPAAVEPELMVTVSSSATFSEAIVCAAAPARETVATSVAAAADAAEAVAVVIDVATAVATSKCSRQ